MNSKEALNKLYMACDNDLLYEQSGIMFPSELTRIIEQSLDRLEKLEKENQKLKNTILSLELDTCIPKLRQENNDLKKVIKILKEAVDEIEIITCDEEDCYGEVGLYQKINGSISIPLKTKEEYILVKEVLESE